MIFVQLHYPQLDEQKTVVKHDSNFILDVSWNSYLHMDWNMVLKLFTKTDQIVCYYICIIIIILLILLIILTFMENIVNAFTFGKSCPIIMTKENTGSDVYYLPVLYS